MKSKLILLAVSLLLTVQLYAQDNGVVRKGRYKVMKGSELLSEHNETHVATNEQRKAVLEYRVAIDVIPPAYRMEYTGDNPGILPDVPELPETEKKETEIDTLIANYCDDAWNWGVDKRWLHTGDTYPHIVWFPTKERSFTPVEVDTLTTFQKIYQKKWKLEETKDFVNATRSYKSIGIPFQFYIKDSITLVESTRAVVKVFGSEDWGVKLYIDGVLYKDLSESTPGSPIIDGEVMRRHTCSFYELNPSTTYQLKVVGTSRISDETDTAEFTITTTE